MKAHDLFENVETLPIGVFASVTAGGGGDNAEVTGVAIDTRDFLSAKLCVYSRSTIAANKALTVTVKVAESDDGSTFGTDQTLATAVQIDGSTGALTNSEKVYELKVDLSALVARKRYLKFKITPDLTAASTDTSTIAGFVELGGARVKAVTH